MDDERPTFFATAADFRRWLERNHDRESVLWVGYYKKATGKPSMTWPESVDEALCYGWIDGLRKSVDDEAYKIRFTPRKPDSHWSAVNLRKMRELTRAGRMTPAGRRIFEARDRAKEQRYSFEQEEVSFDAGRRRRFRADTEAWAFFQEQPPGYRRQATWWVMSAKREETRDRRLATLIADSAAGLRIKQLRRADRSS